MILHDRDVLVNIKKVPHEYINYFINLGIKLSNRRITHKIIYKGQYAGISVKNTNIHTRSKHQYFIWLFKNGYYIGCRFI